MTPQARRFTKHLAMYVSGADGGPGTLRVIADAIARAGELGAVTPARALEALAAEFLATHGAPRA